MSACKCFEIEEKAIFCAKNIYVFVGVHQNEVAREKIDLPL